jgi:hypothetical protein
MAEADATDPGICNKLYRRASGCRAGRRNRKDDSSRIATPETQRIRSLAIAPTTMQKHAPRTGLLWNTKGKRRSRPTPEKKKSAG